MDYFSELRKLVGHRPLLMIGATILIFDHENRLLLMKRSDNQCWGPPGGAIELGEIVEEAAKRETFEETGLRANELSLFDIFSGPEQFYRYPNGDVVYNVTIVYQCHSTNRKIHLSHEHSEWQYFPLTALPTPLSPPILPIMKRLVENLKVHS